MKKETFVNIIALIQEQDILDEEVSNALEKISDTWVMINSINKKYEALFLLLKETMNDTNDWIGYWLYELDGGKKAKKGTVTQGGKNVPMRTVEDLYALLTASEKK